MNFFSALQNTIALIFIYVVLNRLFPDFSTSIIGNSLIFGFAFLVIIFFIQKRITLEALRNRKVGSIDKNLKKFIVSTVIGLFVFCRVLLEIEILLRTGTKSYLQNSDEIFAWSGDLRFFITTLFVAPIVEEYLFRHILLSKLEERNSLLSSLIYSSILFSLIHISFDKTLVSTICNSLFAGFFFGWVFQRTRNLRIVIFIHFIWNFLSYLAPFILFNISFRIASLNDILTFFLSSTVLILVSFLLSKTVYHKLT